jgi:hypothetical protein
MTDETKKPEAKTVANDMTARRVFDSTDAAAEYLAASAQTFADWPDGSESAIPVAAPGVGEAGFDPAIYTDSMDVMVAKLTAERKVKAIVVAPIPKISVILADEAGLAWATKILHKELNHVAVRALREAEDISTVIDQMPTTLLAYIESGRAGSGIMETFNELYKQINATFAAKLPVWAKYRLIKSELKKAMESKAYAESIYAALEDYRGKSLFVAAIELGISAAKRKGLDPTIFERWLATRDQKVYDPAQPDDEDEAFDLDSMTDALLAEEAKDSTDAASADQPDAAPATE